MPGLPLQNPRWEKFCHAYVQGPAAGNATASYLAAGFSDADGSARTGGYRLMNKPVIRTRIAELQTDLVQVEQRALTVAADRLALSQQLILAQIARLGFANPLDYVRRDENGNTVIDLGAVKRDEAAGIVELSVTSRGEGPDRVTQTRIRMCDRHAPLVSLGKHFGLFNDKKQNEDPLRHLSAEELRQRNAELQAKIDRMEGQRPETQTGDARPPSGGEAAADDQG
jgi:uncharacterized small protein (DUF1192 family)